MQTPELPHAPEFDPDSFEPQSEELLADAIGKIEGEIAELQFDRFTAADALALGLRLVELGTERDLPIAIDIRRSDHTVFHVALHGATYDNDLWAAAKSRTALRYAEPSLLVGLRARRGGGRAEDNPMLDPALYAAHGGAFPLYVRGVGPVAVVTVSGLPQVADHDLVVEALRSWQHEAG
ncbi:heme-degrading domain-containing protein [Arthrobacter frigidicola]|nr:heme-degrading domain-containing protein [Arthrobacter frigidicola]